LFPIQTDRATTCWGLALSAAVHAALWLAWLLAARTPLAPDAAPASVMTVALLAPVAATAPAADAVQNAPLPLPALPEVAAEPVRAQIRYFFPEELDTQPVLLRDRSGDADIVLAGAVTMHLFIDRRGMVAAILFDGAPPPALQARLRAAFMGLEFIPGIKGGNAVPARIRIEVSSVQQPG
jgi:hypothetical protein